MESCLCKIAIKLHSLPLHDNSVCMGAASTSVLPSPCLETARWANMYLRRIIPAIRNTKTRTRTNAVERLIISFKWTYLCLFFLRTKYTVFIGRTVHFNFDIFGVHNMSQNAEKLIIKETARSRLKLKILRYHHRRANSVRAPASVSQQKRSVKFKSVK